MTQPSPHELSYPGSSGVQPTIPCKMRSAGREENFHLLKHGHGRLSSHEIVNVMLIGSLSRPLLSSA